MGTSDDRWTCPKCDRTFIVQESFGKARARLAALQAIHAVEHAKRPRGGQVKAAGPVGSTV